jgi:hypothetical protein
VTIEEDIDEANRDKDGMAGRDASPKARKGDHCSRRRRGSPRQRRCKWEKNLGCGLRWGGWRLRKGWREGFIGKPRGWGWAQIKQAWDKVVAGGYSWWCQQGIDVVKNGGGGGDPEMHMIKTMGARWAGPYVVFFRRQFPYKRIECYMG